MPACADDGSTERAPAAPDLTLSTGSRWTVVRTRARAEKRVAQLCLRLNIPGYLPLTRRVRRYQRRRVESRVPLFPGYCFARLTVEERPRIAQSPHVAGLISTDDISERQLLADLREVRQLEDAAEMGELVARPVIVPGRTVTIRHGPLRGVSGIVERRRGVARVTVNVDLIGHSVSVELDVDELDLD